MCDPALQKKVVFDGGLLDGGGLTAAIALCGVGQTHGAAALHRVPRSVLFPRGHPRESTGSGSEELGVCWHLQHQAMLVAHPAATLEPGNTEGNVVFSRSSSGLQAGFVCLSARSGCCVLRREAPR